MSEYQLDPIAYLKAFEDVTTWIRDGRQKGKNNSNEYKNKYGIDTTGWEDGWVAGANAYYGRNASDMSDFSDAELAKFHYDLMGKNEGRLSTNNEQYKNATAHQKWDAKFGTNSASSAAPTSASDPRGYTKWDAKYGRSYEGM